MKKVKYVFLACAMLALCFAMAACAGNNGKANFTGTWYLQYNESLDAQAEVSESSADESEEGSEDADAEAEAEAAVEEAVESYEPTAALYTETDMENFRSVDLDIYINFKEDGTFGYDELDIITEGTWEATGDTTATAKFGDDEPVAMKLDGDTLVYEREGARYYFQKGEDKDPIASQDEEEIEMADENGMSIAFDESEKLDNEITIADDDIVTLKIDGKGVTPVGDPGYNLQITNNSEEMVDVWVADPFNVGDKSVMVYLYQAVSPGDSTTAVLQFDTDDIESKSTDALVDVSGKILVENSSGEELASYDVNL